MPRDLWLAVGSEVSPTPECRSKEERKGGKNAERWMDGWIERRKRNGTMMDGWMDGPKKWMGGGWAGRRREGGREDGKTRIKAGGRGGIVVWGAVEGMKRESMN